MPGARAAQSGRRDQFVTAHVTPIDLATELRGLLFREETTAILTSATLSVGSPDLAYFRDRVGAEDAEAVQIGSTAGTMPCPKISWFTSKLCLSMK